MKKEIELSEEDVVVMDMIDTAPSNNEMSPYFIFYYRKLHPDEEDLEESLIELFEDAKRQPSQICGEDWLYDGYKNYPRLYLILLSWTWVKGNYWPKIKSFCYDIRKYIFENEFDEFLSELTEAHKDKSIVFRKYWTTNKDDELISELKVLKDESAVLPEDRIDEYGLLEAFWERPCSNWLPNDIIYSPFQLGKLIVKFWNTESENVKSLLSNIAQNVGNEKYYPDEDIGETEGELEYHSKIYDDIRDYPLDDIAKHISDPDIRKEVELFFRENMWLKMRHSYKESEFISDTDFMEKALSSKYGRYLTGDNSYSSRNDDARLRSLFGKRDDMIERILSISDVKQQIYLLMCIGTEKSRKSAWNIVIKSNSSEYYVHILYVCGECFQLKYIRKEILKKNPLCIDGIWKSTNEKAIRFLFAILWNNVVMGKDTSLLEIRDVIALRTKFGHCDFGFMVTNLGASFSSSLALYMFYIYAILCSKENDGVKTSDNLRIISEDEYFSAHYGAKTSDDLWIISENNDYSWFHSFDIFYEMFTKNNFLSKNLKKLIALRDSRNQQDKRLIHSLLISLSENKEIEQEDMDKYKHIFAKTYEGFDISQKTEVYENSDVSQIRARIILNANFIVPEYFGYETENKVRQLLQPKKILHQFKANRKTEQFWNISLVIEKMLWKEYWREIIIEEQFEIYRKRPIYPLRMSIPIEPEYEEYILSRADDIFAIALDTLIVQEFKYFLFEQRKKNIESLKKDGLFDNGEETKLLELIKEADHYGLSDTDIINCLSGDKTDEWWEVIHTRLEAEFMKHIFEKCLLWVIKFDKSELWENAPWWGMKIFSKSFMDRPKIWATYLFKMLNERMEETELLRICFAFGCLREPLDAGKVPKELKRISDEQNTKKIKEIILRQYRLFNRGTLKKGRHPDSEEKRVKKCRRKLLEISQRRFLVKE